MTSRPRMAFTEMTRDEIGDIAPDTTVILPTGAVEQHGPFLPVGVDTFLISHLASRIAEEAAAEIPVTVAPAVPFGNSHYHRRFPGALSLRLETYHHVLMDLVDCLAGSGFRRVFILNGHGGNDEMVRAVAREGADQFGIALAACSYWVPTFGALEQAGALEVGPVAGHAGGFETALMYTVRPDLVRADRFPPSSATRPTPASQPMGARIAQFGSVREMNGGVGPAAGGGYSDTPERATPENGKRFQDVLVSALTRAVIAFHRQ